MHHSFVYPKLLAMMILFCVQASCGGGAPDAVVAGGRNHGGDGVRADHGHHDRRFEDPEAYAARWNDPARDAWQRPADIIAAMEIEPGMTVADLGVGTGYFVPHLAAAVGDSGAVLAVDIERPMLDYVVRLAEKRGLTGVECVLAAKDDPRLPAGKVDRILTVNTWHHISERGAYSARLRAALRPGGSVWVVDFREDSPSGPPAEYRIPPEVVAAELEMGGLTAEVHPLELPRQYVVVGRLP